MQSVRSTCSSKSGRSLSSKASSVSGRATYGTELMVALRITGELTRHDDGRGDGAILVTTGLLLLL